ncbi:MAG TPA: hypothetical protein VF425_04185, partial [Thermoanaerobaculia bacterium]
MTGPDIRFRFAALSAVALMGAALLTGCGGKDDEEDRPKSARAAGAAKGGDAAPAASAASAAAAGPAAGAMGAASITGKIVFEGAVPAAEKFKMSA